MPSRYFLPAEWEPHEATWLAWPHNRSDWPGKMAAVGWVFAEIVRKLVPSEPVRILVRDRDHERSARRALARVAADPKRVEFFRCATDRAWLRDSGPVFVRRGSRSGPLAIADFRFNAWAKYDDYRRDDRVASRIASRLDVPLLRPTVGGRRFVLEGGAIDVNGQGTLLSTEQCMLDNTRQARNPQLSPAQIERVLHTTLGADTVFYLGRGISGDDTDGHVDDLCRFVDPTTVVVVGPHDPANADYAALADARRRLADLRLADGSRPTIVELPAPQPLWFDGRRLPASYANFYIANTVVLVPTFNDPADRAALGIFADLLPGRTVLGIHSVDLVWGLGSLHCLTQQQPAA